MEIIRAWSTFETKGIDEERGIIEGIASTPTTDRMGDIVEPKGAQFKLPLPLLWQHNAREPLGHVISAKVTDAGIAIRAQIVRGVLPEIDRAWTLIKAGLVRGLSIGFRATEEPEPIKGTWGLKFTKWEWLELSAVTIPANADALRHLLRQRGRPGRSGSSRRAVQLDAGARVLRRGFVRLGSGAARDGAGHGRARTSGGVLPTRAGGHRGGR